MKKSCLIVDDEPPALRILGSYVEQLPTLELVGKCSNAFEAMEVLARTQVDILFLDIKMPRLTGTVFLRSLKDPPKVIFTTAYQEFAVEAFDLEAIDYLLKPVSFERFIRAVNKVCGRAGIAGQTDNALTRGESPAFLYFRSERKMVKVLMDDILYVESLKDYIRIVRRGEKPLVVKKSIASMDDMLPAGKFLRIHRSFIIAKDKVTAFTQQDVEIGGVEIPIGRVYAQQVKLLNKRKDE